MCSAEMPSNICLHGVKDTNKNVCSFKIPKDAVAPISLLLLTGINLMIMSEDTLLNGTKLILLKDK